MYDLIMQCKNYEGHLKMHTVRTKAPVSFFRSEIFKFLCWCHKFIIYDKTFFQVFRSEEPRMLGSDCACTQSDQRMRSSFRKK